MARYDICVPRPKKDGGTYWHKIGAAFDSDKGGFDLTFDSLPPPTLDVNDREGTMRLSVRAKAFPAKEGDKQQSSGRQQAPAGNYDEDGIPF